MKKNPLLQNFKHNLPTKSAMERTEKDKLTIFYFFYKQNHIPGFFHWSIAAMISLQTKNIKQQKRRKAKPLFAEKN